MGGQGRGISEDPFSLVADGCGRGKMSVLPLLHVRVEERVGVRRFG